MKRIKLLFFVAFAVAVVGCQKDDEPAPKPVAQTEWLSRPEGFQEEYELQQMVVLSRHNIRTPFVGKGSVLSRVTNSEYEWYAWDGASGLLTPKGDRLEVQMGEFFREWLDKKGLLSQYKDGGEAFRFYANAKQRCQETAKSFAGALLPGGHPEVEMHVAFDTMDPVFNPQITKLPDGFEAKAQAELRALFGDLNAGIAASYSLVEDVIDITHSPAYPDTTSFSQFPSAVGFKLNAEPFMTGGLKMACTVSDALVLQYYEEPDVKKAGFGKTMTEDEWTSISAVKEWYEDALFTAPSVALNVAHPLLEEMLVEIRNGQRVFSMLCGHDSNLASVLAALEAEPCDLPGAIEKKTPIGSKLIVETFAGKDGGVYADLWLVYASAAQLRAETDLSYKQPPMAVRIRLQGLQENPDGLYRLADVEQRFSEAISAYDAL